MSYLRGGQIYVVGGGGHIGRSSVARIGGVELVCEIQQLRYQLPPEFSLCRLPPRSRGNFDDNDVHIDYMELDETPEDLGSGFTFTYEHKFVFTQT